MREGREDASCLRRELLHILTESVEKLNFFFLLLSYKSVLGSDLLSLALLGSINKILEPLGLMAYCLLSFMILSSGGLEALTSLYLQILFL